MKLKHTNEIRFKSLSERLLRFDQVLSALNPKNVLSRGFSYVTTQDQAVVTTVKDLKKISKGTELEIHFYDGKGSVLKG
jgi:exodeoxyribonuclease VII large subunit